MILRTFIENIEPTNYKCKYVNYSVVYNALQINPLRRLKMLNFSKKSIKTILSSFGLEVHRQVRGASQRSRASMQGCLQQARQNGLSPDTIMDVGAARGTPALYEVFPNARHIFIEPLKEFVPHLDSLVQKLNRAEYIVAAATSTPGNVVINIHPDLEGSSMYKENEDSNVNGVERTIPAMTIDRICQERGTTGSYLIKIDTQGSELDVLIGAEAVLQDTEFIILEVSLFEFFQGGPQLYDCINFMKNRGFVAYDVFDLQYRLLDGAMSQVDIAFVREQSKFRKFHFYATQKQRNFQNKLILQNIDKSN
jgi:FkbM family methyltransferase